MHTLSAYVNPAAATPSTDLAMIAIPDQTIATVNNAYQFTQTRKILRAFAAIPNGTVVRLSSPSYNRGLQPVIDPIDADVTPGGNLPPICDYEGRGPDIPKLENFAPLLSRTGGIAADCYCILWSTPNFIPAPSGPVLSIRGTGNATGAANGWRLGTIVFDQNLPNEDYAVVGMRVTGANCLAARLVFPNQYERPGTLCNVDPSAWIYPAFRFGRGGLFGKFSNTALPQLEVLGTGAVAAQVITLDLIPRSM